MDSRDRTTGALLLLSAPLLAAGLLMPAVSITKFSLFGKTYSILEGVLGFWSEDRYGLFLLVFAISGVLPVAKTVVAIWAWRRPGAASALGKVLRIFAALSKWSMLDVVIVAVLVLALEGSLFTTADIHAGLALFAAAVLTSSLALHRMIARTAGQGMPGTPSLRRGVACHRRARAAGRTPTPGTGRGRLRS